MISFFAPLISLMVFLSAPTCAEPIPIRTIEEEVDIRYKKQIPLYLQHDQGDVTIQGWNQDLVRVKLIKKIQSSEPLDFESTSRKFTLISLETPKSLELRVGTPPGLDLLSKLKARPLKSKIRIDLEIRAPASMDLSVVLGESRVLKLLQWRGKTTIQGLKNEVEFYKFRSRSPVNVNCPDCRLKVEESEISGNFILGDQPVVFRKTTAGTESIRAYLKKGNLELDDTRGNFEVRQDGGNLNSRSHVGLIQAILSSGSATIMDLEGDLDLQGSRLECQVQVRNLNRHLLIRNQEGSIELSMPDNYCGEVSLQSIKSDVRSEFPLRDLSQKSKSDYGPELRGRVVGLTCSPARGILEVYSDQGSIQLKKRNLSP